MLLDNHKPAFTWTWCRRAAFSSLDKFDSGTGWPSFTSRQSTQVVEKRTPPSQCGRKYASKNGGFPPRHVFDDVRRQRCGRFCINSASLSSFPWRKMDQAAMASTLIFIVESFREAGLVRLRPMKQRFLRAVAFGVWKKSFANSRVIKNNRRLQRRQNCGPNLSRRFALRRHRMRRRLKLCSILPSSATKNCSTILSHARSHTLTGSTTTSHPISLRHFYTSDVQKIDRRRVKAQCQVGKFDRPITTEITMRRNSIRRRNTTKNIW